MKRRMAPLLHRTDPCVVRRATLTMEGVSRMSRLFGSIRKMSLALVALAVVGTSMAPPALAQDNGRHVGWDRNGKASQKAAKRARKAEQKAQKANAQIIVVDPNDRAIDRSRRRSTTRRDTRYSQQRNRTNSGARVYDYRNSRNDPYTTYPQYRQNPYNRNGGYYAGFDRGAYDSQRRNRANPQGHGAYQHGFDGYDPSWGSSSTYQQNYRSAFIAGYQDGYGQRSYSNRYPRNRWW